MGDLVQKRVSGILGPALAAVLVIAIYGVIACTSESELGSRTPAEAYYNRLIDGFAKGQLSLDLTPPPGLALLPDPYDPKANAPFHGQMYSPGRIHDLSYYRGRLYLYFSVVPALVLFLPFHWLTSAYISHQQACFVFCSAGFLASAALVDSIRRRCFPGAGAIAATLCTLSVGLIPLVPIVLQRPEVWEVAVTASYSFWMISLLLIWISLARTPYAWGIALCASATIGLAVGCRPSSCLGAAILLLPLVRAIRAGPAGGWRKKCAVAASLVLPMAAIGMGLLAYNYARFGNVFEFGEKYQLNGDARGPVGQFHAAFVGYNLRLYFLEYPGWQRAFPFVRDVTPPPMPAGHGFVDSPVGVLFLLPFVLFAAAVPFGLRAVRDGERRKLTAIAGATLFLFMSGAGPLCFYLADCVRYQLEFVPALVLLATIGYLALVSDLPEKKFIRSGLIGAAGCAAAVSIAFNLLMAVNLRGNAITGHGVIAMHSGQLDQAADLYRRALRLRPANVVARVNLADIYVRKGRFADASVELGRAVVLLPDSPEIRLNYAYCLYRLGRLDEALDECEAALKIQPDYADARNAEQQLRVLLHRGP